MNIIITYIHINSNFTKHVRENKKTTNILKINEIVLTINYLTAYIKLQQNKNGGYDHFPFVDVETAK